MTKIGKLKPEFTFFKKYHVTPDGQVFNLSTGEQRIPTKVKSRSGKIYHSISFRISKNKFKTMLIHRAVAIRYLSRKARGWTTMQVDHIDRDTTNNNMNNLRWVSAKQNQEYWRRQA